MAALVTRRALIGGGLAAGAALALAGGLRLPAASEGGRVLSLAERDVVAAVSSVMFPGVVMPRGTDVGVVDEVDRILAEVIPAVHAMGFRYLLRGLEWGPLYSHGDRFSRLDIAQRTEVLQIWADPAVMPRRVASDALKMVMGMAYFRNPAVHEAMGYHMSCGGGVA
jgi:hypothetical protein